MSYSFRVYEPLFESNTIFNPLLAFLPFHLSSREVSAPPTILSLYYPGNSGEDEIAGQMFQLVEGGGGRRKEGGIGKRRADGGEVSLSLISYLSSLK